MLGEVLQTFAEDFAAEYDRYRIPALFDETLAILNSRSGQGPHGYANLIRPVRERCDQIIADSRFNSYPAAWLNEIERSSFARYLPARAAQTILNALPTYFDAAPLSSEFALYQAEAMRARTDIEAYRAFSRRFAFDPIVLPDRKAAIVISMPRATFAVNVKLYSKTLDAFSEVLASLAEIVSGDQTEPEVFYTSSSDLHTALLVLKEHVWPFIEVYTAILITIDVIAKTKEAIERYSRYIAPKKVPDARAELKERIEPVLNSLRGANPDQQPHLGAKLTKAAANLIDPIQKGARASFIVSPEDEPVIHSPTLSDGATESLRERMQKIQRLESDIPITPPQFPKEAPTPALLTHEPPETDE